MWNYKAHKYRTDYSTEDDKDKSLKAFGYGSWSKTYHNYCHPNKDGSYKWLNGGDTAMAEALEYANLSKSANSSNTTRGYRVSFSKAPNSFALLNRRIMPGSNSNTPSLANPKVAGKYKVETSPKLHSSLFPGLKIGYKDDTHKAQDRYTMSSFLRNGGTKYTMLSIPKNGGNRYTISSISKNGGNRYTMSSTLKSGGNGTKPVEDPPISHVSLSKNRRVLAPPIETSIREVSLSKVSADMRKISHIRVVVHDASSHAKSLKTTRNHWSLYLILHPTGAVRASMTMSESNTEILEWTLLQYPLSLSKIQDWDFQVAPNITVAQFYRLIHDNGRHRYLMGRQIDGDRFWIYSVISDMEEKNWLVDGWASDEVWEYLHHFYLLDGSSRRVNMVAGLFY